MKSTGRIYILLLSILLYISSGISAHVTGHVWTLEECIQQALNNNIQLQQRLLTDETSRIEILQAKAARYPEASASLTQNFAWNRELLADNTYGPVNTGNNLNIGVSSSVTLYNGFRINNTIRQAELNFEAGQFDTETLKDDLRLNILSAYLQVLYATEEVMNSRNQLEATSEELRLAGERLTLGAISMSDYLLIKAQLAEEQLTLTNKENQLVLNKVILMQLMEVPVSDSNYIQLAPIDTTIIAYPVLNTDSIFSIALEQRPEIRSAGLNKESAYLDVNIAWAGLIPRLSLQGSLYTYYSSGINDMRYSYQLENRINPAIGLSLAIPIYQNRQIKSKVEIANIAVINARLNEANTVNQLRKAIEQAYVDVSSASKEYDASIDKYQAQSESYKLASEKFSNGLINSVDFLFEKTNLIIAESNLLQSKYKLIYSIKILDFYRGKSLI